MSIYCQSIDLLQYPLRGDAAFFVYSGLEALQGYQIPRIDACIVTVGSLP